MDAKSILDQAYNLALGDDSALNLLEQEEIERLETVVRNAETQKAVVAVLMTSLVKKIADPKQDVRYHKAELPNGYSGRTYDTNYITPFLKEKMPRIAMQSGSGWLTRSLEQAAPFTLDYRGRIRNKNVRDAFLNLLHSIEVRDRSPQHYLNALFVLLVRKYSEIRRKVVPLSNRIDVTIDEVIDAVGRHFESTTASRLPVIALFSAYELLMEHVGRYRGRTLVPLQAHTTADSKSHSVGDIQVLRADGEFWEAVEVKHGIQVTANMVLDAYVKIQETTVNRYYVLTTAEPPTVDQAGIDETTALCRSDHGCEMIVNGVIPTLRYYLRLIPRTSDFLTHYTENLNNEYLSSTALTDRHLEAWRQIQDEIDAASSSVVS